MILNIDESRLRAELQSLRAELDRAKESLLMARHDIVELAAKSLPDDVRNALLPPAYLGYKTKSEFWNWQSDTIHKIVDAAKPDGGLAYCPLCKEGVSSWGQERGWQWPGGLYMHLNGEGRTTKCTVIDAAFKLAEHYLGERFEEEHRQKQKTLEARRKTERVFLVDPTKPPELLDEHRWLEPRTVEQLAWAEARLKMLGFEFDLNGNVMAYRLPHPELVILADPRAGKSITIRLFRLTVHGSVRLTNRGIRMTTDFDLRDHWTRDIQARFKSMLDDACKSLAVAEKKKPRRVKPGL